MKVYEHPMYREDLQRIAKNDYPWEQLRDKTVLISGATGLIGSVVVDVLMLLNQEEELHCQVIAIGRNAQKVKERFGDNWESPFFTFVQHDINEPLYLPKGMVVDFVLHMASNTHPIAYASDPIGTILTNVLGLKNMLDLARENHSARFIFASSNEVYGENRKDVELFDESYCGYIDSNTLRAGYPESKRCGEALCQAYRKQMGMDIVIARFTRSYGPTMKMSDSKAISQFVKKGVLGEDIVLKSEGNQFYSYTYVTDAVGGIFTILFLGEDGQAYNISDEKSDIRLKDLARIIANTANTNVIFEFPDEVEAVGYSTATKARIDGTKLKRMGWKAEYDIESGLKRTIKILQDVI